MVSLKSFSFSQFLQIFILNSGLKLFYRRYIAYFAKIRRLYPAVGNFISFSRNLFVLFYRSSVNGILCL